jgi:hypothetical protein
MVESTDAARFKELLRMIDITLRSQISLTRMRRIQLFLSRTPYLTKKHI